MALHSDKQDIILPSMKINSKIDIDENIFQNKIFWQYEYLKFKGCYFK